MTKINISSIGKREEWCQIFRGIPIGTFDTILESALKSLILLGFSLFVIPITFDDFFEISSLCDTKLEGMKKK